MPSSTAMDHVVFMPVSNPCLCSVISIQKITQVLSSHLNLRQDVWLCGTIYLTVKSIFRIGKEILTFFDILVVSFNILSEFSLGFLSISFEFS